MGLHKQYLKVGQSAKNSLFGVGPHARRRPSVKNDNYSPLQMLVSGQGKFKRGRLAVIVMGLFTLALGIILSSIPWVDYLILKNLRLWNGTLSYHYWQRPGVMRLTKVYIFNVTNPDGFLNGEKPRLVEVGPFVYKEDMQKVNIKFNDNGTVSYQHHKILEFMPDMSASTEGNITVPNIPLLTLTTQANTLPRLVRIGVSLMVRMTGLKPFVSVPPLDFLTGYDDTLVRLAHTFLPVGKRPQPRMGLLLSRNGTLSEVHTIFTGHNGMEDFGVLNRLNGLDRFPYWSKPPCSDIRASEGSFFPPRYFTNSDIVHVYDKDLCRIWPLQRRNSIVKDGIHADVYTPPENIFEVPSKNPDNKCFYHSANEEAEAIRGLQDISPCQFNSPIYLSYPHFYQSDPSLLEAVEGLKPDPEKHQTFFHIQPKIGVPIAGQVRLQMNLKVERSANIHAVSKFPSITFPIIWLQEGISEVTEEIANWIYLGTTLADIAVPIFTYGCIVFGLVVLVVVFVRTYKNVVFTKEALEKGKETLRRGSSFIVNGQHRLLIVRESYSLLNNMSTDPDPDPDAEPENEV